ncbi:MAG TPA: MarR family winged helix-turn-helix transcriptional regulator [Solirubrobacteraceae bacterium]|nr:MarR family winged helix-turn-helix transcriptional regulator [Solirubrobacteraceae bacterium]
MDVPARSSGSGNGRAAADPRAEGFLDAFETLAQAVRRARGAAVQDAPDRLTLSQYSLLTSLATGSSARVSDLAGEAGITPSTASRILDALERRDVVRRDRAPEDRRVVVVSLTDTGREALHRQDEWMRARQMTFFDDLPGPERDVVSDLLVRLADLIDELNTGPAD